jgi:hypothetical protein
MNAHAPARRRVLITTRFHNPYYISGVFSRLHRENGYRLLHRLTSSLCEWVRRQDISVADVEPFSRAQDAPPPPG